MHSIAAAGPSGEVSRAVSPRTSPLADAEKEARRRPPRQKSRPQLLTRPSITAVSPPSEFQPASPYPFAFPASGNYMSAVVQSLDPRPLDELHNERSYLLYDLQKQCRRATKLFERYAAAEARLSGAGAGAGTAAEAKKRRREAAAIRAKIAESTQQEHLIVLRLGEIHVELQNRARWMQVLHHHPHRPLPPQPPPLVYPPPLGGDASSPYYPDQVAMPTTTASSLSRGRGSCGSALSPLSPAFTPGVLFAEDIWSRESKTSAEKEKETENESAPAESTDEAEESNQAGQEMEKQVSREGESTTGDAALNRSSAWETDDDSEAEDDDHAWTARLRRLSLYVPRSLKARDRRMSLPSWKGLWPKSRRNSLQSTAGEKEKGNIGG